MSNTDFPSMGATLFFGLTVVALLGHTPSIEPVNPKDTHDQTNFTQDRADVDFAQFVAWSFPLGFADAGPDGRDRPLSRPVAARVPTGDTQVDPQHGQIQAQIALSEVGVAPDTPDLQAVRSLPDRGLGRAEISATPATAPSPSPGAIPQSAAPVAALSVMPGLSGAPITVTAPALPSARSHSAARFGITVTVARLTPLLPDTGPEPPRAPYAARVTGNFVHLRRRPARDAASLGKFNMDTPAVVLEQIDDWALTTIDDGLTGWMFAAFLEPAPRQDTVAQPE